ncbi:MAG: sulfide dehydrogenase, cytochrome subunit [Rhodospirillaceae bacterium]|nr:MAG: sulfide dehydrogenase, cytochrome subunit [Rhodospirillaceae bacterium]
MKNYASFKIAIVAGLSLATIGMASSASAQMASGQVLANTCFSCHGPAGHSAGDMPTLAGKDGEAIKFLLEGYRSGNLKGTVMNRIAKGYSSEEIKALAGYFSSQAK